jgi:type I restriction enzyme R subunit
MINFYGPKSMNGDQSKLLLSPDAFLRPFMDDYLALTELYGLIRNAYSDRTYVDKELTEKTKELLREHTTGGELELPGAIHALGPEELAALKDGDASDTTKILNLRKILSVIVADEGSSKPFLLSIGERAEKLAQAYEDRQLTTQQTLFEFERLAQEYVTAQSQRQQMGADENTFAIFKALQPMVPNFQSAQATEINALFARFPDYQWDDQQKSRLRAELYKALRPIVGAAKLIEVTNSLLRLQRV